MVSAGAHSQKGASNTAATKQSLIADLYDHPWAGASLEVISPTMWAFGFTKPMLRLLEIGPDAQGMLLDKLSDPLIKDQVIILLGGIGDERAIEPIINAMIPSKWIHSVPNAERINESASLALTNITAADVIWHHGGGISIRRCPENPKECWSRWWEKNRDSFKVVDLTPKDRAYANYPNYGIYSQVHPREK